MKQNFEAQIQDIFGATDPKKLREIAEDAERYRQRADSVKRSGGRKKWRGSQDAFLILCLQPVRSVTLRKYLLPQLRDRHNSHQ